MEHFQQEYEALLWEQELKRGEMISKWELYSLKHIIQKELKQHDKKATIVSCVITNFYLAWYIQDVTVEKALKTLVEYFPDLEISSKEGARINCSATHKGYKCFIEINLSNKDTCQRVHVRDEVRPVYEYVCP